MCYPLLLILSMLPGTCYLTTYNLSFKQLLISFLYSLRWHFAGENSWAF